ncbi:MAG: pyridoxamine kinase [Victivallales bacterium]|nr:pyridoxamine kinase [Victivallales bacterium]
MKKLLSIQDISCYGQCSLTVALPIISACGIETAVLPSAVLSAHTGGFKEITFRDLTDDMPAILKSWLANDIRFDAFYTGYVCERQIAPIQAIIKACAKPGALRIVDPVMGDDGVLYSGFTEEFPQKLRPICVNADYLLPNLTEAALLLGEKPRLDGYDQPYIEELLRNLYSLGAKNIILTGVSFDPNTLGVAIYDGKRVAYDFNPRLPHSSPGTGDVFASVFTGAILRGKNIIYAASLAADIVCLAMQNTPPEHWYGVAFETAIPELVKGVTTTPPSSP